MKQYLRLLTIGVSLFVFGCSPDQTRLEPVRPEPVVPEPEPEPEPPGPGPEDGPFESMEAAVAMMGAGWNLGNTLDSHSGELDHMWIEAWSKRETKDYETAWGQPVTTRELIHMFK